MGHEMNDLEETRSPSSSVGDYLKAIWELAEASGGAASTKDVAARLSVSSASVSNMFASSSGYTGASIPNPGVGTPSQNSGNP